MITKPVLLSAYACEPDKGSEPGIGWNLAVNLAARVPVVVLTRANNKTSIEKALTSFAPEERPDFVYHDLGQPFLRLKKFFKAHRWYYLLWQKAAKQEVARLVASRNISIVHHTTYASFRYPTAVLGHGVPAVWGPVGGVEATPWNLMPWHHPLSLRYEVARNAGIARRTHRRVRGRRGDSVALRRGHHRHAPACAGHGHAAGRGGIHRQRVDSLEAPGLRLAARHARRDRPHGDGARAVDATDRRVPAAFAHIGDLDEWHRGAHRAHEPELFDRGEPPPRRLVELDAHIDILAVGAEAVRFRAEHSHAHLLRHIGGGESHGERLRRELDAQLALGVVGVVRDVLHAAEARERSLDARDHRIDLRVVCAAHLVADVGARGAARGGP